jgi:gliding motility-associated-like protein
MFRLLLFTCLTSFTLESSAQLCSGSLGDPVATIDFGNGSSGFGLPLPAGKTNYSFVYNSCPVDGQYTITSATLNCFSRSWHSITNDHTPDDEGGYFMLVNASVGPGVFYVDTVKTLCDNTTYEFSSYIINMTNSSSCGGNAITPNLTFTIETESGQLLTKYNTGNIAVQANPDWKQYGTYITTPANAGKIIIKISNNAPGGCGNDLALDDIVFRPCGPKVELSLDGKTTTDVSLCLSSANVYSLGATFSAGFIDPQKQWQSSIDSGKNWQNIVGEVNSFYNYQPTKEGMVLFRLLIGEGNNIYIPSCRIASSPIKVTINHNPTLQLTKNLPQCVGSTLAFTVSGTTSYQWIGPNGFNSLLQNPTITNIQLSDAGMYYVTGTNSYGCKSTDSVFVHISPPIALSLDGKLTSDTAICLSSANTYTIGATFATDFINPQKQWQSSIDSGKTWQNIVGETNSMYKYQPSNAGTIMFRLLISEGNNAFVASCRTLSSPIKVTINSRPTLQLPKNLPQCVGSTVALNVSGTTSYQWVGPNGFNSLLQNPTIANIQPSNIGKYYVTGTSLAGCKTVDSIMVQIFPPIQVSINPTLFGCEGDNFQLSATGGMHYKWSPAVTLNSDTVSNPIANPTISTQYAVTITDQYGCSVKNTTQIKVSKIPVVDAGPDKEIVRGDSVQLMARITGIDFHYSWYPTNNMANSNSLQPFVRPQYTQRYMLTAVSDSGCGSSVDAVWITVIEAIKIPNTFTPNGDGINDQWVMANIPSPNNFIVEIYTATGQLVYRKVGYNSPWDGSFNGKKLPPGTYYYVVDTKLPRFNKMVGFVTMLY